MIAVVALIVALSIPLYRSEYGVIRAALLGAAGIFFLTAVARVLGAGASLDDAALEAGKLGGERKDELLSALELSRDASGDGAWTSGSLREAAVEAAASRAGSVELGRLKSWKRRGRWLGATGLALLALAVAGLVGGARTPLVLHRIADPEVGSAGADPDPRGARHPRRGGWRVGGAPRLCRGLRPQAGSGARPPRRRARGGVRQL